MTTHTLSAAAKQRGLFVLLFDTMLMWGGFFMIIPLLSVHYVDNLGWAAASIGLVLGVRQLTQQGLTLFGGALADRFGAKGLIWGGLLLRAVGFAGMAWATNFPLLMLTAVLAALGGALFESPRMAAITALTDETNRVRFFSLAGVFGGVGMTLGPLIGAALLKVDFGLVALLAAACFFTTFVVTILFLPPVQVAAERQRFFDGIGMALRDRQFMLVTLLLMGFWFMWVQLTISLPLVANNLSGSSDAVGWVYALNSGMMVVLQYPLLRWAERELQPLPILMLGVAVMALGLGFVSFAQNVPALLVCVALFSVGAILALPSQQTVTAKLANPAALGSYFGVSSLALAIGGGIGNVSGGLLYDWSLSAAAPALPWLVFCVVGLIAAAGLDRMNRRNANERHGTREHRPEPAVVRTRQ